MRWRLLSVPPVEKLERHGVASVRQRVMNLSEIISDERIKSVEDLESYLVNHFSDGEIILTDEQVLRIDEISREYEEFK